MNSKEEGQLKDNLWNTVFVKDSAIAERIIDGKAVIVKIESDEVLVLNDTGTILWQMVDGRRSAEEILKDFSAEYDTDIEETRRDIEEFLYSLYKSGLIKVYE